MTKNHLKPVTLYVDKITAEPELVTEETISHIDVEVTKPQAEELIEILFEKLKGTVGAIRVRFTGRMIH